MTNTKKSSEIGAFFRNFFIRVSIEEQILFARHLSVMSKAGLPLLESIKMIRKDTKSRSLGKILDQVIKDVSNGQFLSVSLERYQTVFGSLFINIIRVGESTGILPENLNYLADELKKKRELKKKVIGALIYPAVILVATFGITGLLTVFIFPKILPVFASLKVTLPPTTRALIWISNLLTTKGGQIFGGLFGFFIFMWVISKFAVIRYILHFSMLKIPIFGKVFRNVNLANFCRTLGLTLKAGVKVVEAINITSEALSNKVYVRRTAKLADQVQKGEAIAPFLNANKKLFPVIVGQMVSVGETAGNLSETLLYLSEYFESEVNEVTKNLSTVLEPMLMVLMGAVVGFMAISIITPIYEVSQNIGR